MLRQNRAVAEGLSERRRDDVTGDGTLMSDGAVQSDERNYDDGTGDGTAHKCVEGGRRIWRVSRTTGQPQALLCC